MCILWKGEKMKDEKKQWQFSRFSRKLKIEGLLKALLVALTVGFGVVFVVAMVTWFIEMNSLMLCIGIVAGALVIGIPVTYLIFFRPTIKSNARRIDRLGLEERMITMVELEGDESILSRLQREDAQKRLAEADEKQMKICVPRGLIVSASVATILGIAMATLSTLAAMGFIMSGAELMDPLIPDPPVQYVYIEYVVDEGGYIEGEEYQEIVLGESGTEVMAVAEEGWIFEGWTDGDGNPVRLDKKVEKDMLLIAVFVPDEGEQQQQGEGEGEGDQDTPTDMPAEEAQQSTDSEQEGEDPSQSQQAGGKYDAANQIIDGETHYRDVFGQYDDQMQEEMTSSDDVPEDIRDIVENYFEIIG
jgi:hypothetical protein